MEGPGLDSGPANGIVRTFDTVEYRIDWSVNAGDTTNVTVRSTLPTGMTWAQLPPPCQATTVAASSINGRDLVCNLGDRHQGEAGSFGALARVGILADAAALTVVVNLGADASSSVTSNSVSTLVSARAVGDLVTNSGGTASVRNVENPLTHELGMVFFAPLSLEIPGAGKGAEPLAAQDLHVSSDLSALPPSATLFDASWSLPAPYNAWTACGPNNIAISGMPFGSIGVVPSATAANSVEDSGVWTCGFDSVTRKISINIAGAQLSPASRPTADTTGFALAPGRTMVIAGVVGFFVSDADLQAISGVPGSGSLANVSTTWATLPTGVSGATITSESPSNDVMSPHFEYTTPGGHSSFYVGKMSVAQVNEGAGDLTFPTPQAMIPTVPQHTPFVPTQTQAQSTGDGTVTAGERFGINMSLGSSLTDSSARRGNCVQLSAGQTVAPIGPYLNMDFRPVGNLGALFANTPPVVTTTGPGDPFVGDLAAVSKMVMTASVPWFAWFGDLPDTPGDPLIEYSTDPHHHEGQCNSTYSWSATPPADLTKITQVRVTSQHDMLPGEMDWVDLSLQALPQPVGSKIWHTSSSMLWPAGTPFDPDAAWDNGGNAPGYDPTTWCNAPSNPPNQNWNDCLTISGPRLSIAKRITSGKSAGLAVGEHVTYQIEASVLGGTATNFVIDDVLPPLTHFTGVASPMPTNGAGSGSHALQWDLGNVASGETHTISVEVEVEPGYTPFQTITNTATLAANYDIGTGTAALPSVSSSAQLQTSGTFAALAVQKATTTPVIAKNQSMQFSLNYTNSGVVDNANPTFIEVLPWNGDARSVPTRFAGTTSLASVTAAVGDEVRYSAAAPSEIHPDPADPSNDLVTGATKWCLAAQIATSGCPASIGASTAVRIMHPGNLAPGESLSAEVVINTSGNLANDAYTNNFTGRVDNIELPVTSNDVTVRVEGVDLSLQKIAPATAVVGGTGTFTLNIHNQGPSTATNVVVTDPLPAGMSFVSETGNATFNANTVTWTIPSIADGETVSVEVTVRFDTAGIGRNTANIDGVRQDERPGADNESTATVRVLGENATASTTTAPGVAPTTTPATPVPSTPLAFTGSGLANLLVTCGGTAMCLGFHLRRTRSVRSAKHRST